MSEYQFLEFLAIDRRLTDAQMAELRTITSRAEITPTSLTNEYHFGSFKGDEYQLLQTHFDAFYYFANWGTERLLFRLPLGLFDARTLDEFAVEPSLELHQFERDLVVEFTFDGDAGGYYEGADDDYDEGWNLDDEGRFDESFAGAELAEFVSVRAQLLAGDLRPLYLGWLSAVALGHVENQAEEPTVPPGLGSLDAGLMKLAQWLRIPPAYVRTAAEQSPPLAMDSPLEDVRSWLLGHTDEVRLQWLIDLLRDATGQARTRLQLLIAKDRQAATSGTDSKRRTAKALRQRAEKLEQEALAAEQGRLAEEKKAKLRKVAEEEPAIWQEVDRLITSKRSRDLERAVDLLIDLREMAEQERRTDKVQSRIDQLHQKHIKRRALIRRFRDAQLIPE